MPVITDRPGTIERLRWRNDARIIADLVIQFNERHHALKVVLMNANTSEEAWKENL